MSRKPDPVPTPDHIEPDKIEQRQQRSAFRMANHPAEQARNLARVADGKTCGKCRFWSELVARAGADSIVEAVCLVDGGKFTGRYTAEHATCGSWKTGNLGSIDDPRHPVYPAERVDIN